MGETRPQPAHETHKPDSHNTSSLAFLTSTAFSHPARPATATDTVASTMLQESDLTEIQKTKRRLSRMFVYLEKRELVPPCTKRFEDLQKKGQVKEMSFTRIDSAADIKHLLAANFPILLGSDLKR